MDLIELRLALRRNWLFGAIAVVVVAVAGLLATGPGDMRFEATSTVLVAPRAERMPRGDTDVLRILLPNVLALATSDRLLADASRSVGEEPDGVSVGGGYEDGTGVLVLRTRAGDGERAITWSRAVGRALVEAYEGDPYLDVDALDPATAAAQPGALVRQIDRIGVVLLSLFAGMLTVFVAQRLRESGDIIGRLRSGGLRVVAELPVASGRRAKEERTTDHDARRLALSLSSAPGIEPGTRFVVVGESVGSTMAVVQAMRSGLASVGRDELHRVALGPTLGDLRGLQQAANGSGVCVAVLDQRQRVDRFVHELRVMDEADVPVAGVVVVKRG